MYFYYFMLRRYQNSYQQIKCILCFLAMLIPVLYIASVTNAYSGLLFQVLVFLTGWVAFTFVEYILHRFWMHSKNSYSSLAATHHYHHTHPTEIIVTTRQRMIMLLLLAAICCIAVYLNNYFTCLAGFCFGIVGYFMMHKIIHMRAGQRLFKKVVLYHIYHHCKYPNTCFGISVTWWDDLFKTVPKDPKISQRIIDFYFNEQSAGNKSRRSY